MDEEQKQVDTLAVETLPRRKIPLDVIIMPLVGLLGVVLFIIAAVNLTQGWNEWQESLPPGERYGLSVENEKKQDDQGVAEDEEFSFTFNFPW